MSIERFMLILKRHLDFLLFRHCAAVVGECSKNGIIVELALRGM